MATTVEKGMKITSTTVARDVQQAVLTADSAVSLLRSAADVARAGGDWKPVLQASGELARDVLTALGAFLDGKPLLSGAEAPALKELSVALKDRGAAADSAHKDLMAAASEALVKRGVEKQDPQSLEMWNERHIAGQLADRADKLGKPVFVEYFGVHLIVEAGAADTQKARIEAAIESFRGAGGGEAGGTLRNASQQAARRVEITEGQARPMRSIDEITAASVKRAVDSGYKADSLAGTIGFALQDVVHHGEIDAFAKHLLEMALKTDLGATSSHGERADRARDRASYWVNHYGRNEREIDKVWLTSLDTHAKAWSAEQTARDAARIGARAAEIDASQGQAPRSIAEIEAASIKSAGERGYKPETLAAQIGYALQDLTNHKEIGAFAEHLVSLALKGEDLSKIEDKSERLDRARDRAGSWVNHFGRNERAIDAVWYGAIDAHVAKLKG